jgi:hypothetical protein
MRRRTLLSLSAATLAGVAGCTSDADEPSAEPTPTPTPEPTPTPTPTPAPEPEFVVRAIEAPAEVAVGETYQIGLTVANTGTADGTFEGTLTYDSPAFGTETSTIRMEIPAGETRTRTSDPTRAEIITELTMSIGDVSRTIQFVTARLEFGEPFAAPTDVTATALQVHLDDHYQYERFDGETTVEHAPDGQQYAFLDVQADNDSGGAAFLPFAQDFTLRHDSAQYDAAFINREQGQYEGGEVGPGVVRDGWIAYEIPATLDREELTVEWFGEAAGGEFGVRWAERE